MANFKTNIFSIEEKDRSTLDPGYLTERVETTDISDGDTAKDRHAINKLCTSIPSPFARLFFFRTAFKEVQKRQEKLRTQGVNVHRENRLYNYLVSDCFDMLEFLFYYGADPKFNVITWKPNIEIENLHSDKQGFRSTDGHKRLAKALKDHLRDDSTLSMTDKLYIFTWNDNPEDRNSKPVVIGGSSPFSLVYTSPNWVREMNAHRWTFNAGKHGAVLFENDPNRLIAPRSLQERSERFREYIYNLWNVYLRPYKNTNKSMADLEAYIDQSYNLYDQSNRNIVLDCNTTTEFLKKYGEQFSSTVFENGRPKQQKVDLYVIGDGGNTYQVPLRAHNVGQSIVNEDYMIALPSEDDDLPMERTGLNGAERVERPLVLSPDYEIGNALYYEDEPWGNYSHMMPEYANEPENYWERTLPGTPRKHPYLCIDDFLEKKIIMVSSNISSKHFLTGNLKGDVAFLPPLKRTFFKFFKLEDIYETVNGEIKVGKDGFPVLKEEYYHINVNSDESVTVTLKIPVKSDQSIEFERTYMADDGEIAYFDNADAHDFNLSIFPFYKLIDSGEQYNMYSVMLGYMGDVKLHFYSASDLNNEIPVKISDRTLSNSINTRYYTVDQAFDFIEIECDGIRGIAMPLMKRIKLGTNNLVFCVDFGTTNTHVAWGEDNGTTVLNTGDFTFGDTDGQVVSLYDTGAYMMFNTTKKREFLPDRIEPTGAGDTSAYPAFPIRTTACVSNIWSGDQSKNDYQLYGDINVGFFFLNDNQTTRSSSKYVQNLKWSSAAKHKFIRQGFFDEMMWLIKNKAVLNGGSMDFKFYFTYPQSMPGPDSDELFDMWDYARINVKAGDPKNNHKKGSAVQPVEGIVPWLALRKSGQIGPSEKYLNVDIGGGTMDMVYQDPEMKENYTFSARFAANDLWGDGIDEMNDDKKNNAFVRDYSDKVLPREQTNPLKIRYDNFVANSEITSSDIISFLFKYDKDYEFTKFLQRESYLMTLVLMHFVSIAYYIGLVLDKMELDVPDKIGFTGMGSLYLKILSPNANDIAEIIKSVLRYQGVDADKVSRLQVILNENPKVVTARGGVVFHRPGKDLSTISQVTSCVWGYKGETDTDILLEKDAGAKKSDVLSLTRHMFEYFSSDEFNRSPVKSSRKWKIKPIQMGELMRIAEVSYNDWMTKVNTGAGIDVQSDPVFFWPLKDTFFKYGPKLL